MKKRSKRVLIFGATGSIGISALEIVDRDDCYELVGFSFNKNIDKAKKIKKHFSKALCFSPTIYEINDVKSFEELIICTKPDIILNSIVGFPGLEISLLALKHGIDLALANKESLVVAGWLIKKILKSSKSKIYPVDSEHSGIFDIVLNSKKKIKELILTASGGPFFDKELNELENIKFSEAIMHPNWKMGYKISIDSATLMNKAFEIIEAYYLFDFKNIKVYQHKQSIVHSLVKFSDNSLCACMSVPDMKLPINQGLSCYKSEKSLIKDLDFDNLHLNFKKIDLERWKPISWAYDFIENNNKAIPIIMNSANDELIELFREGNIKFNDITSIIDKAIIVFENTEVKTIDDIYSLHDNVKKYVNNFSKNKINYSIYKKCK